MLVRELIDLVDMDYEVEGRVFLVDLRCRRKHIDNSMGDSPHGDITHLRVQEYKLQRRREGAAESTVNHELNWLSRGFKLAAESRLIEARSIPKITRYRIGRRNVRHEVVGLDDFAIIHHELSGVVRDFVTFLYNSGWRFREATSLRWRFVSDAEILLPACETKEAKMTACAAARILPLQGVLLEIIERRRRAEQGEYVFHRRGQRIVCIRKAWDNALKRGGVEHMGLHALRKGFCTNGIQAGVDRDVLMEFTGHKTDETFRRYNLVSRRRKREAMEKMEKFAQGKESHECRQ